jgi:hypothetical protein
MHYCFRVQSLTGQKREKKKMKEHNVPKEAGSIRRNSCRPLFSDITDVGNFGEKLSE